MIQIFLCPKSFLDEMGVAFKADEAIEVKGSKVKQGGADLILAREMVKGGETLTFRFQNGKPRGRPGWTFRSVSEGLHPQGERLNCRKISITLIVTSMSANACGC